jgi:hypothetical protein
MSSNRHQRTRNADWMRTTALISLLLLLPSCLLGQSWVTENVDDSGKEVGEFSSMAVDGNGDLHVAYWDATTNAPRGQLIYAFRTAHDKKWSRMVVDRDGTYVSLAVDSANLPHIVYNSRRETGLHYAHWDGKQWHRVVVDPGHTNYFACVRVDAEGHPKISYYLYHLDTGEYWLRLKYAYFDEKQWYIQTVDPHMHTGKMNSLALDSNGNPFISYSFLGPGDMLYARWQDSHWKLGAADLSRTENTHLSYGNSAAMDSLDRPRIAYFDNTKNTVKYAHWDGTRWLTEVVDHLVALDTLDQVSLKIDRAGVPHIAYYDAGLGILKYATRDDHGWKLEVVDRDGNVGMRPTLALNANDEPFISYYDVSNQSLRVAHRETLTTGSTR